MRRFSHLIIGILFSISCLFLLNSSAQAGGCFYTTKDGSTLAATCVKWEQTRDVVWNYDAGPLKGPPEEGTGGGGGGGGSGCQLGKALDISNAEAVAMIERSFKRWTDVARSQLNVVKGTTLLNGEDVNFSNIENVWAGKFKWPTPVQAQVDAAGCYDDDAATPCLNPIIFDHSGLITQAIQGECTHCSILGFAAILPQTADDAPQETILSPVLRSSQAVVSGACLEPRVIDPVCGDCCPTDITPDNVEGTMTHELGHYLGLDHTLVNKDAFVDCSDDTGCSDALLEQIPTMIGFFVPKMNFNTLHEDDKKTFASMYPDATLATTTCSVTGISRRSDNTTPQRCLEVVARQIGNDRNIAVATISGSYVKRFTQGVGGAGGTDGKNEANCDDTADNCARYEIHGLEPGNYMITVQDFTDPTDNSNLGFVLEPCTPPLASASILDNPIDSTQPFTNGQTFVCTAGGNHAVNPRAN
jgi:hypothetical protein